MKINNPIFLSGINNQKKINFGRNKEEHESWGAVYNPTKDETTFKLFAYPESNVQVLVSHKKEPIRLWEKLGYETESYKMKTPEESTPETPQRTPHSPGVYIAKINGKVHPGDQYCFEVNGERVPDPYSFKQPGVSTWSVVYDKPYKQEVDKNWRKNPARVVRNERVLQVLDGQNVKFTPLSAANIYEAHIGTLTDEGTFEGAIKPGQDGKSAIQKIKEKGFNSIEIMPLEGTHSFNWGYDGVNKFAARNDYGGPDKAREFIKHCHKNGLSVIVDFVPNHIGVDGNYLSKTGKYAGVNPEEKTCWGDKFHLEKGDNRYQKDFVSNMALYWLRMGADGLRADMTSQMGSDRQMKQIAAEVNEHFPDGFLIAEDPRMDNKITQSFIKPPQYESHDAFVEAIMSNSDDPSLTHLGFDSRWGFKLHHNLAGALIGRWEPSLNDVYGKNVTGLYGTIISEPASHVIKYIMSHDEIGNHNGTRLIPKIMAEELKVRNFVTGNFPYGKNYPIGEQIAHNLCVAHATGEDMWDKEGNLKQEFTKKAEKELKDFLVYKDFAVDWKGEFDDGSEKVKVFSKKNFEKVLDKAIKLQLVGNGMIFAIPGPNMSMQGNENLDLTPFRFARKFENDPEDRSVKKEKGYDTGEAAFKDSKLSTLSGKYSPEYKKRMEQAESFYKILSEVQKKNPALQDGQVVTDWDLSRVNDYHKILAIHAKKDNNEIFSIANFDNIEFLNGSEMGKYEMKFPEGKWQLLITSDTKQYGGDGKIKNPESVVVESNGGELKDIEIPAHSFMMFRKIA